MKKTALALFALLLVAVFQFSNFANANPAPYPTTPNQELPTLSVESPYNEEVFTSDSIRLNFTVTTPDSWNIYWMTSLPIIGEFNVEVYLDGIEKYHEYMVGSQDTLIYNYSIVLDGLTEGKHTAKSLITVRTFFQPEHANDARIYLGLLSDKRFRSATLPNNFSCYCFRHFSCSCLLRCAGLLQKAQTLSRQPPLGCCQEILSCWVLPISLGGKFFLREHRSKVRCCGLRRMRRCSFWCLQVPCC
jgi:hypothetical protein